MTCCTRGSPFDAATAGAPATTWGCCAGGRSSWRGPATAVDTSEFKGVDDLPAELLAELELAVPRALTTDELTRALRAAIPLFFARLRTFDSEEAELADRLEPHLLAFVEKIA